MSQLELRYQYMSDYAAGESRWHQLCVVTHWHSHLSKATLTLRPKTTEEVKSH